MLYELITGTRPFTGSSQASVIASILKEQARPLHELQPLTPPGLEPVLQTCLEKDPDQRWQSAREVKHALAWMAHQGAPAVASTATAQPVEAPPAAVPAKKLRIWQTAAATLALAVVGLAGWMLWHRTESPAQVTRFQVPLPENVTFGNYVSLSPDGRKLVFNTAGTDTFWIRDLDALEWRRLAGTEGAGSPFWSPDSRFLAFAVQNKLKKIDVASGAVQTLCTVPVNSVGSGAWNRDGVIVFGGRAGSPLWKVSQAGGVPTALTAVDTARGETFHALPSFMPDGKHFIYFRQGRAEVAGIYTGSLETKPAEQSRERLQANTFAGSYVNGYLFFMRENNLMAQPFEAGRMQFRGEPVPLVERVATSGATGVFSVSPGGALAWRAGGQSSSYQLTWFDRQGKVLSLFGQPGTYQSIALSPDGTRGVVRDAAIAAAGDLWTLDFARGVRTRFTFRKAVGSLAVWSPDGSRLAFAGGNTLDTVYEKPASGAGAEKELLKDPGKQFQPSSWSHDGRFLLYTSYAGPKTGVDLMVLPLEGPRKPVALLATDFNELEGVFSPDMRWIAYASNESGRYEVYVRPFAASGPSGAPSLGEGKWQISKDGGTSPKWSADCNQIIFVAPPNAAKMAVEVKANGAAFEAGVPQLLFQPPQGSSDDTWDVTADGKRFLEATPVGAQTNHAPINITLNWPALLKKQ